MDRCALFVDAGYVLADGAMAVHGTRRRQSVSWDYGGLLQLLSNLALERTGLPLLRCYWYEHAADERRSAEQEALADMPGVKLRLVKTGSEHDGIEGEMRRDLVALARNRAVSDAMVISSAEELTRVVADVQDFGMRVTLLHLAADGNWTVSRTLRQECDDIVEISPAHLRPYVELISGAEPPRADEPDGGLGAPGPHTNGHVPGRRTTGYQRPVPRLSPLSPDDQAPPVPATPAAAVTAPPAAPPSPPAEAPSAPPEPSAPVGQNTPAGGDLLAGLAAMPVRQPDVPAPPPEPPRPEVARPEADVVRREPPSAPGNQSSPSELPARRGFTAYQDLFAAPVAAEAPPAPVPVAGQAPGLAPGQAPQDEMPADQPGALSHPTDLSGYAPGALRLPPQEPMPPQGPMVPREPVVPREPMVPSGRDEPSGSLFTPRRNGSASGPQPAVSLRQSGTESSPEPDPNAFAPARPGPDQLAPEQAEFGPPAYGRGAEYPPPGYGQAEFTHRPVAGPPPGADPLGMPGPVAAGAPAPASPGAHALADPGVPASNGHAGGALQSASAPQAGISLADAVQSAHEEGREFGGSVARDAPTLWLEAVLARKPRMPSDLEARLLQGSSLPIDFLLHDEVRHALRRGFWDSMERARR